MTGCTGSMDSSCFDIAERAEDVRFEEVRVVAGGKKKKKKFMMFQYAQVFSFDF